MPLAARAILIVAAVCLGVGVLFVGTGLVTTAFGQLGSAVGDAFSKVSNQTAAPHVSGRPETDDRPVFDQPDNDGYTNQAKVALSGSVPGSVAGKEKDIVRIYSVTGEGKRLKYQDVPVGATVKFGVADVTLAEGVNKFVATIVTPTGEGGESDPVIYNLDTKPPTVKITSPAANAQVTANQVTVTGTTEASATVSIRNTSGPGSATVQADGDGAFKATIALIAGSNSLSISATDRAGNTSTVGLAVRRSLGKLAALLSVSPTKLTAGTTTKLTLSVRATASDGSPLAGAKVVFTVNVSGVGPITSGELTTDAMGQASWTTTVDKPTAGPGMATVVVSTPEDGNVTSSQAITVDPAPKH